MIPSFDIKIIGLLGIFIALLLKFTYWKESNSVEQTQKRLIKEIKSKNSRLISNARRVIRDKQISNRERNYIKQKLAKCNADYSASDLVLSISGIAVICLLFSFFLIVVGYWYYVSKFEKISDMTFLTEQSIIVSFFCLVAYRQVTNFPPENNISFNLLSAIFGVIALLLGCLIGFFKSHFCPITLPFEMGKSLFYIYFFCIPIVPLFIVFISTVILYICKQRSFLILKKVLKDQKKGKLKQNIKIENRRI